MTELEKFIEELNRKSKRKKIPNEDIEHILKSKKSNNSSALSRANLNTVTTSSSKTNNTKSYANFSKKNFDSKSANRLQSFSNKSSFDNSIKSANIKNLYTPNIKSHNLFKNSFLSDKQHKAGNGINVVVKSNYAMSGRLKNGKRISKKAVKSLSTASLDYISNHGNKDLENSEELSSLYDSNGERLSKEEFKELKKEIYQDDSLTAMRRIVISPKEDIPREDMKSLTVEIMRDFEEQTGKNLNYHFAVHTDTEHIHSHVVITGTNRDINFTKEQLQKFREISEEKTLQYTKEQTKELEKNLNLNLKRVQEVEL